jgi:hypothetical protein
MQSEADGPEPDQDVHIHLQEAQELGVAPESLKIE